MGLEFPKIYTNLSGFMALYCFITGSEFPKIYTNLSGFMALYCFITAKVL